MYMTCRSLCVLGKLVGGWGIVGVLLGAVGRLVVPEVELPGLLRWANAGVHMARKTRAKTERVELYIKVLLTSGIAGEGCSGPRSHMLPRFSRTKHETQQARRDRTGTCFF